MSLLSCGIHRLTRTTLLNAYSIRLQAVSTHSVSRALSRTTIYPSITRFRSIMSKSDSNSKSEESQGKQAQNVITSWASKDGTFNRLPSSFRNHITVGGEFPPEKGRYILYVSLACPWAHRTLIVRTLKGLEDFIDVAVVHPFMGALGWSFYPPIRDDDGGYPQTKGAVGEADSITGVIKDPLYDVKFLRELYFKVNPDYEGRFTVPVLWDKKEQKIVNNESSEIIRMLNKEFNSELSGEKAELNLVPSALETEIDSVNSWVYDTVNNGVYKSGFATKQKAYEAAVKPLFESLNRLESMLKGKTFVVGDTLTEVDVRLYTTIIRFDPVYEFHFKCNIGMIRVNFPNLNRWMKNLYHNYPAFKDSTNFEHIKQHYFTSHPQVNPTRIVPLGPVPDIEPL